ncbi:MAG: hypothetical protein ACK5MQ_16520 [Pikeienuella sp.]
MKTRKMLKSLAPAFFLTLVAGAAGAEAICAGHHMVTPPAGAEIAWKSLIDGEGVSFLPSDGRTAQEQATREDIVYPEDAPPRGEFWFSERVGIWDYVVFKSADPGDPFGSRVATTLLGDRLIVSPDKYTRKYVVKPEMLQETLPLAGMRVVEAGPGYRGDGFCLDGVALEGFTARHYEVLDLEMKTVSELARLSIHYLTDAVRAPMPTMGESSSKDGLTVEWREIAFDDRPGVAMTARSEGKPTFATLDISPIPGDRTAPRLDLFLRLDDAPEADAAIARGMEILEGVVARE